MFLDSVREQQEEEERQRKERDGEEVRGFREYVRIFLLMNVPAHENTATTEPSHQE